MSFKLNQGTLILDKILSNQQRGADIPGMEVLSEEMGYALDMLDKFDFEGMPDIGDSVGSNKGFCMSDPNSLIGVMNHLQEYPAGTTFNVEFEVDGNYTKY